MSASSLQDDIPPPPPPPSSQTPTQQTPHTVSTIKLPILIKGEYDIWAIKMEHYLAHTDYPIWEVSTTPNPYSVATQFGGVTDWYQRQGYREPDTVMSDSEDSTVTYTAVSSPFGGLSDIRSLGVDRPPVMPEDPYAYPLSTAVSPTADSPGYVPEEDPEEDDDEDPEEDPDVFPNTVEWRREHTVCDSYLAVAYQNVDQALSAEETKPYEPPKPFWFDTKVARLLAIPTPPPSPLSPWSSPLPQIPSPPLPPILSLLPVSPPLLVSSPPPASPIPGTLSASRKRLGIALGLRYEVGERSSAPTARPPGGFRLKMCIGRRALARTARTHGGHKARSLESLGNDPWIAY
ncbi:hypothetical protein Tco_0828990 [Tanacetum coccineum]